MGIKYTEEEKTRLNGYVEAERQAKARVERKIAEFEKAADHYRGNEKIENEYKGRISEAADTLERFLDLHDLAYDEGIDKARARYMETLGDDLRMIFDEAIDALFTAADLMADDIIFPDTDGKRYRTRSAAENELIRRMDRSIRLYTGRLDEIDTAEAVSTKIIIYMLMMEIFLLYGEDIRENLIPEDETAGDDAGSQQNGQGNDGGLPGN